MESSPSREGSKSRSQRGSLQLPLGDGGLGLGLSISRINSADSFNLATLNAVPVEDVSSDEDDEEENDVLTALDTHRRNATTVGAVNAQGKDTTAFAQYSALQLSELSELGPGTFHWLFSYLPNHD
jgi:hypothetical protein